MGGGGDGHGGRGGGTALAGAAEALPHLQSTLAVLLRMHSLPHMLLDLAEVTHHRLPQNLLDLRVVDCSMGRVEADPHEQWRAGERSGRGMCPFPPCSHSPAARRRQGCASAYRVALAHPARG